MSIRPLSSELQKVAEKELNEVPSRVQDDITRIREWLSKQPHLKARTDDQWLIAFLRGCKFSLERTKEKLDLFYTIKTLMPEVFHNRDPLLPEIQEVLRAGAVVLLPKTAHPAAPRLLMYRPNTDPDKVSIVTLVKTLTMVVDVLLMEDDNYVVAGGCGLADVKDFSYKYIVQLTPDLMKKIVITGQEAYATRIKGVHLLNTPSMLMTIVNAFKMLIHEKIRNRMCFYNDRNLKDLYDAVPLSLLPKEYGGGGGSCDEIAAYWKTKLESYRDWFLEDSRYGTDESKRPGKAKTAANLFGVEGSFRKLEVD